MRVLVIGGGVIGTACAIRLQDQSALVTVIDAANSPADRASWGNAGMIANELAEPLASRPAARKALGRLFAFGGPLDFVLRDADLWAPWVIDYLRACRRDRFLAGARALNGLCVEALPAWRRMLASIGSLDLLDETPHWAVWERTDALATGARAAKAGSSAAVRVRDLIRQEIEAVRREASSAAIGGVAFEGSARIHDPGASLEALHGALQSKGGQMVQGEARGVRLRQEGVEVDLADGRVSADLVLVAAGARSAPFVRQVGLSAPLVAERGYHLQYRDHDLGPELPALIFEDRFICVVRVGDDVRVTGFTEIGRPGSPPDPRKWAALERHVAALRLPVRGAPDRWMGARPTLPDFLPAIGRKGPVLYAFGHQHLGLTLAAATADAIGRLAKGDPARELSPFALERFGRGAH